MRCLTSICFLLCSFITYAQKHIQDLKNDFVKPASVSVLGGVSIPLADYADKNYDNRLSGYADPGYTIHAHLKIMIESPWGAALGYLYCNNPFDSKKLESDIKPLYPSSTQISFKSDPWEISGFYLMPLYILSTYKLNVDLGIGPALFKGTLPYNTVKVTPPGSPQYEISQNPSIGYSWGFIAGVGLRYKLTSDIIFTVQGDYMYSDITFKDLYVQVPGGMRAVSDYKQPFRILNFSAGFGYQFD